ncbi:basic helix-loop-helix (bHLH) DNA-binding superfamily protein [Rhynchospora pubera]|uniref:Basic helix-loop-helix (BHLH) DNA-binding superfamily protein n=1 Tax=Rhynchospora pubera TaxID=906938 RepID=A0AAV8DRV4_9POAL|nr:basic helix-loop-helix (bHLH) DNA-binding superfamily protein [Rhynchospora pubera]
MVDRRMLERKILERKRRIEMESLLHRLQSLLPPDESSQEDPLHGAAMYIKNLEERIKMLMQIRDIEKSVLEKTAEIKTDTGNGIPREVPTVALCCKEEELEIIMVSSVQRRLRFCEVIDLLEREGICITKGTQSFVGDRVHHAIYAEASSEIEIDYHSLLMDKLKALAQ